jgi:hypothetical protein
MSIKGLITLAVCGIIGKNSKKKCPHWKDGECKYYYESYKNSRITACVEFRRWN